eukprot:EG_transcript_2915
MRGLAGLLAVAAGGVLWWMLASAAPAGSWAAAAAVPSSSAASRTAAVRRPVQRLSSQPTPVWGYGQRPMPRAVESPGTVRHRLTPTTPSSALVVASAALLSALLPLVLRLSPTRPRPPPSLAMAAQFPWDDLPSGRRAGGHKPPKVKKMPKKQTSPGDVHFISKRLYLEDKRARTVVLYNCPPSATGIEVQRFYPRMHMRVRIHTNPGPADNIMFVTLPTKRHARIFLEGVEGRELMGHPVRAQMAAIDDQAYFHDRRSRTVLLTRCPQNTTWEALRGHFPDAVQAILLGASGGRFRGRCLLVFRTAVVAQAVVSTAGLKVLGQPVVARMAAPDQETAEADEKSRCVFIYGFPTTTPRETLQHLFPTAEEVEMLAATRCGPLGAGGFAVFTTPAEAQAACAPGHIEVDGQMASLAMAATDRASYYRLLNERTVVLTGFPQSTTAKELQQQFPRAVDVVGRPKWPGGRPMGQYNLTFPSVEEAVAVANTEGLTVLGEPVLAQIRAADKAERQRERDRKTVLLARCPLATTVEELEVQFPTAEEFVMLPPGRAFGGRCLVIFPTLAEAEAVVGTPGLEVKGQPVSAEIKAVDWEAYVKSCRERAIVVTGCPLSITPEDLRRRFPQADEVVVAPLAKGDALLASYFVTLGSVAEAQAAAAVGTIEVDGHVLGVRMSSVDRDAYTKDAQARLVVLSGCPATVTTTVLKELFPGVEEIRLLRKYPGGPFGGRCLMTFPTVAAAEDAARRARVTIHEQPVVVQLGAAIKVSDDIAERTVELSKCPPYIEAADLSGCFPAVEAVLPRLAGVWHLRFRTAAEAKAVARTRSPRIMGKEVVLTHLGQVEQDRGAHAAAAPHTQAR